jgi:hypothetical protein
MGKHIINAAWWFGLISLSLCSVNPAAAQVDQQRAEAYFKEAATICQRDGGRLWGVSLCGRFGLSRIWCEGYRLVFTVRQRGRRYLLSGLYASPISKTRKRDVVFSARFGDRDIRNAEPDRHLSDGFAPN